jgi:hypothetical protein
MLYNRRKSSQRQRIAYEAARMLADGLCQDIRTARQKAAERTGIVSRSELPTEGEIELALKAQQSLFQHGKQPVVLSHLRQQAVAAMKTLARFSPHLVGPVLNGTAEPYNKIQLHLFSETTEEVILFLLDQKIPWRDGEKTLYFKGRQRRSYPVCSFRAGETEIELTLLPLGDLRRPPLGPLGDRLLQRASLSQLQELMKEM